MRRLALALLVAHELTAATLVTYSRHGNRFILKLSQGAADLEWITPSTFRFRRTFALRLPGGDASAREPVTLKVSETPEELIFTTTYLVTALHKQDLRLQVSKLDGGLLMKDLTAAERREDVISWERAAPAGVRYYGLGARTEAGLNLRGTVAQNATPFLFTTAGYGENHVAPGRYEVDMARLRRDRYRIEIRNAYHLDYYFYYGPTPKEIFEEHSKVAVPKIIAAWNENEPRRAVEASLSGIALPVNAVAGPLPAELRKMLSAYFAAYEQEVHDRGFPILHALPFQFPRDLEADKYPDEFMLGDELLIGTRRNVYLPMGIWTNLLKPTETFRGRQVITTAEGVSVFARNGTIVPLTSSSALELHYFPKLGAEFFLFERDAADYTQVHAAPAADFMRLEIESKVGRVYEWAVHHLDGARKVESGGTEYRQVNHARDLRHGTWHYDADGRVLRVRASVAAGQDHIVNLSF